MIHLIKDIEGRKVKIFYYQIDSKFLEQNKEFMKILDEQIISVCKEDESAKNFPVLNFLIFGKNKLGILRMFINNKVLDLDNYTSFAFVRTDKDGQVILGSEVLKNECTIYINSERCSKPELFNVFVDKNEPMPIDKRMAGILTHELMHLRHFQLSEYSKTRNTSVRLNSVIEKTEVNDILSFLQLIRKDLYLMLEKIIQEGIAKFRQSQKTGYVYDRRVEYTKDYFVKEYNISNQAIHELLPLLHKIFIEYNKYLEYNSGSLDFVERNFKKIKILVNGNPPYYMIYKIGFHMVYTILYVNKDIDINMLAKMDYIQIIKLYEKSVLSEGKRPIISYTSRNGVFDYVGWLENINDTYNAIDKYKNRKKK